MEAKTQKMYGIIVYRGDNDQGCIVEFASLREAQQGYEHVCNHPADSVTSVDLVELVGRDRAVKTIIEGMDF